MTRYLLQRPWAYVLALFLAIATGALLLAATQRPAHHAKLTDMHLHATPESMQTAYAIDAPGANGAPFLYEAASNMSFNYKEIVNKDLLPILGDADLPEPNEAIPADMLEASRRFLEACEAAFPWIDAALEKDVFRYAIDHVLGRDERLYHVGLTRSLSRLLHLQAVVAAESGDAETAAHALVQCIGMVRCFEEPSSHVNGLVRAAMKDQAFDAVSQVLARTSLSPEQLARIRAALDRGSLYSMGLIQRDLAYDAVMQLHARQELRGYAYHYQEHTFILQAAAQPALLRRQRLASDLDNIYAGAWTAQAMWRLSGLPQWNHAAAGYVIRAVMNPAFIREPWTVLTKARLQPLEELTQQARRDPFFHLPMYSEALKDAARGIAQMQVAHLAVAVLEYEAAHGAWPPALAPVVEEKDWGFHPLDAGIFTGRPLKYRTSPEGFIIYCAGPGQEDDNGRGAEHMRSQSADGGIFIEVRKHVVEPRRGAA